MLYEKESKMHLLLDSLSIVAKGSRIWHLNNTAFKQTPYGTVNSQSALGQRNKRAIKQKQSVLQYLSICVTRQI